jgi:hypothetical protein
MLRPKPLKPISTRPFTHIAGVTAANQVAASRLTTFGLGAYVIQRPGPTQRFPAVGTFIPPKVKDMLSKSCLRLTFTKEFRALDVMFHVGTAL